MANLHVTLIVLMLGLAISHARNLPTADQYPKPSTTTTTKNVALAPTTNDVNTHFANGPVAAVRDQKQTGLGAWAGGDGYAGIGAGSEFGLGLGGMGSGLGGLGGMGSGLGGMGSGLGGSGLGASSGLGGYGGISGGAEVGAGVGLGMGMGGGLGGGRP